MMAETDFAALAARLTRQAQALAEALGASRALRARGGGAHWRQATLLWPWFTKG